MTTPFVPSSRTWSPTAKRCEMSFRPTTAGIFSERAMIAVCDVRLPTSVANPRTSWRFSVAVSEGVILWATTTCGRSIVPSVLVDLPSRLRITRRVTS